MVSEKMYELGSRRSEIRELFEYGLKRKAEIGAENVFDFSLGNPSVPAPQCVKEALSDLILNTDPVVLPEQALVVSEILEAIYTSSRTGKAVYFE